MDEPYKYCAEAIQEAGEEIQSSPYGLVEDMLEDVLFLGAVGIKIMEAVPSPADWVEEHQNLILGDRDDGYSFVEIVNRVQNLAGAKDWMARFCNAVYPQEDNAKYKLLEFAGELEALSFSRVVQVEFVAHAFLLTEPVWRAQLLINLAAEE